MTFFTNFRNMSSHVNIKDQVSLVSIDILKYLFEAPNQRFGQELEQRDCLGRRLCQMSQKSKENVLTSSISILESAMLKLTTFTLLYVELEDHTQTFIKFIEAIGDEKVNQIDCENLFWKCATDDNYFKSS